MRCARCLLVLLSLVGICTPQTSTLTAVKRSIWMWVGWRTAAVALMTPLMLMITGDAFAAGNVSNVTGVHYPLAGLLVTGVLPSFTKETTFTITAIDDAATLTAGSISLVVYYVVP
jgi:hypothetical protein